MISSARLSFRSGSAPRSPRSLLLAAAALATLFGPGCASGDKRDDDGGARLEQPDEEGISYALARIARLEDARSDGEGELVRFLRHGDAGVRRRAATALGRLDAQRFGGAVTAALAGALADEDPSVRRAVAFAIGQRGDVDATQALLERWKDPDPLVRAALVEAASKLKSGRLREEILFSIGDEAEEVRREVVLAPHRWRTGDLDGRGPSDEQVDTVLIGITQKMPIVDGREAPVPGVDYRSGYRESSEVVWRALFSLARRGSERARSAFLMHARATEPVLSRLFAMRGLAAIGRAKAKSVGDPSALPDDVEVRGALEHALADADWRVVCEALVGLGANAAPTPLETLAQSFRHDSAHVRRVAYETLPKLPLDPESCRTWIDLGLQNRSTGVRAAALVALAEIFGEEALEEVRARRDDPNAIIRIGAARAAGAIGGEGAISLLFEMAADESRAVAGAAIEALGPLAVPDESDKPAEMRRADGVHDALRELLAREDNGLRLAVVGALVPSLRDGDLSYLRRTFETARGDIGNEVRTETLRAAAKLESPDATALLESGLDDPYPFVRSTARELLLERDPARTFEPEPTPAELPPYPLDVTARATNPRVEVVTSRGVMVFELFSDEAPMHVRNFLELAERGFYDGLNFHRVVPDFVIQGGCYRGDGNGSLTWRDGQTLRQEIGMRKYVRGSLGMPRNSDLESGGSQIFVTHRPTPHLDGRYTIFGELREGFEVLDSIEVGDQILSVDRR